MEQLLGVGTSVQPDNPTTKIPRVVLLSCWGKLPKRGISDIFVYEKSALAVGDDGTRYVVGCNLPPESFLDTRDSLRGVARGIPAHFATVLRIAGSIAYIDSRDSFVFLKNVLCQIRDGNVTLVGSNNKQFFSAQLPAKTENGGDFLIPGESVRFSKPIINAQKCPPNSIEANDRTLTIRWPTVRLSFALSSGVNYPEYEFIIEDSHKTRIGTLDWEKVCAVARQSIQTWKNRTEAHLGIEVTKDNIVAKVINPNYDLISEVVIGEANGVEGFVTVNPRLLANVNLAGRVTMLGTYRWVSGHSPSNGMGPIAFDWPNGEATLVVMPIF